MSNMIQNRQKVINSRVISLERGAQLIARKDQYEVLIEFQLKRQKEECKFRRKNIKQRNIYSTNETIPILINSSFCTMQGEIGDFKIVEKIRTIQISNYLQEIANLEHLVIRLEDQINMHEINQKKYHQNQKQYQQNSTNYSEINDEKYYNQMRNKKTTKRQQRSKTLMDEDDQTFYKNSQDISVEISKRFNQDKQFYNQILIDVVIILWKLQWKTQRKTFGWYRYHQQNAYFAFHLLHQSIFQQHSYETFLIHILF